jgi:transaldolase
MDIFIDTADLKEIESAAKWGIIAGVTTNPSLIVKAGGSFLDTIKTIVKLVDGPISAEVKQASVEEMLKQAKDLAKLHSNIVVKVPMTPDGITLTKQLSKAGIKTNVTLVFSLAQALLAANAGATYVSPFLGRVDDKYGAGEGYKVIKTIKEAFIANNIKTKIIAASIRSRQHVEECAHIGIDVATIPYKYIVEMFEHELTTAGLAIFKKAEDQIK